MIGLVEGNVFATFLQAILFGLYLASLAHCLRWQILDDEGWRLRKKISWAMLIVAVLLFLFSTIDLAISLYMTIAAVQGDIRSYSYPWAVNTVLEISSMLITDAVLIYRCWVVYARSLRIVCLPILFWISFFTSSILCTFYYTVLLNPKNAESAFHATILQYRFYILLYCANIATNIYATTAIVFRILKVAKGNSSNSNGSKRLHNVCRILAESGILFTSTSILSLVAIITESQLELRLFGDLTLVLNFAATGITFNLILIRVGQDRISNTYDDSCTNLQSPDNGGVLTTLQFQDHISDITTITGDLTSKVDRDMQDSIVLITHVRDPVMSAM
ncbi:hypothetical protein JOM56_002890 [Amanita muscaria]